MNLAQEARRLTEEALAEKLLPGKETLRERILAAAKGGKAEIEIDLTKIPWPERTRAFEKLKEACREDGLRAFRHKSSGYQGSHDTARIL